MDYKGKEAPKFPDIKYQDISSGERMEIVNLKCAAIYQEADHAPISLYED